MRRPATLPVRRPRALGRLGRRPVRLLGSVPPARLADLTEDRRFLRRLAAAADDLNDYVTGARWYQAQTPDSRRRRLLLTRVRRHGRPAPVLRRPRHPRRRPSEGGQRPGVPLIGVGLLYRHGYFRQSLSRDGWQQEHYPVLDPNELPVALLEEPDGTPAQVPSPCPAAAAARRIWLAQVGRVPLLMLDSDVEENDLGERGVTDRLYGGGSEHRLLQEMLLGIGGVRAVRTYCRLTGHAGPEVFHTNEGHAGFLGLERIAELCAEGLDFDSALEAVRAGTVFTTHTPVPAGIDRFDRELVARHFGPDAELPRIDVGRVLQLGMETYPGGEPNLFNMAVMGLRLAQRANGVSLLHGKVSREMFSGLWPGFDPEEVPITSVTNGVHAPTWVAPEVFRLGARQIGAQRTEDALTVGGSERWDAVADIPDQDVWELRRVPARAAGHRGAGAAAGLLAATRRRQGRAGLDRRGARPGRPDHRLRPARPVVQAADADAARPGPADGPAAAPRAADPDRGGGQGAPRGRRREAAGPGAGAVRGRPAGPPPDRVPARLRHGDGAEALPGLRHLAQQPAAPAGGLRHERDEGGAERLPQPVRAGRLVGRVVPARLRLGRTHRRRRGRRTPTGATT